MTRGDNRTAISASVTCVAGIVFIQVYDVWILFDQTLLNRQLIDVKS